MLPWPIKLTTIAYPSGQSPVRYVPPPFPWEVDNGNWENNNDSEGDDNSDYDNSDYSDNSDDISSNNDIDDKSEIDDEDDTDIRLTFQHIQDLSSSCRKLQLIEFFNENIFMDHAYDVWRSQHPNAPAKYHILLQFREKSSEEFYNSFFAFFRSAVLVNYESPCMKSCFDFQGIIRRVNPLDEFQEEGMILYIMLDNVRRHNGKGYNI